MPTGDRVYYGEALILVCAVSVAFGAFGAEPGPEQTYEDIVAALPRHDVSGVVVDKDGNPVKNAEVFCYYECGEDGIRDRLAGKTNTNRKGRFRFKKAIVWEPAAKVTERDWESDTGKYVFIAKHPDHGINFRVAIEGDDLEAIEIPMREPKFCKAIAEDVDGNRLEGVHVYLCDGQLTEEEREGLERVRHRFRLESDIGLSSGDTDETGRVELMTTVDGPTFYGEKEGCVRAWRPASPDGKTLVMQQAATVSGTVRNPGGEPAAGVAVYLEYHGESLFWSAARMTDEEGRYTFEQVPGAGFWYSFAPQGKEREKSAPGATGLHAVDLRPDSDLMGVKATLNTKPGETYEQDLELEEARFISGSVVHAVTGEPLPEMNLRLLITVPGQRYLDTKDIDVAEDGTFKVLVAPGAECRITPERSREGAYIIDEEWRRGGNWNVWQGTVHENIVGQTLKIKTWPVTTLEGRVVGEDGQGVAKAKVYMHSEVDGVPTEEDGSFVLKVAPTDRDFDLFAITEDGERAGLAHLGAGTQTADVPVKPTRKYEGVVTNHAGLPANNLKFYMDLRINDDNLYRVRQEPKTDDDGRFTAEHLCPDATYYAWWSADHDENRDYSYGNATIDLTRLGPGDPIAFKARQYIDAMMGTVVDSDGNPVAGARVSVTDYEMRPQDARNETAETDGQGGFVLERLAHGSVAIQAEADGYKPAQAALPSDAIDAELVLRSLDEPCIYKVAVIDEDEKPLAGVPVEFYMSWHSEGGQQEVTETRETDAQGHAVLEFQLDNPETQQRGRLRVGCDIEDRCLAYGGAALNTDANITLVARKDYEPWVGRLRNEAGEPVEGAELFVNMMRQAPSGDYYRVYARFGDEEPVPRFTTDAEGRFVAKRFASQDSVSVKLMPGDYVMRYNVWFNPREDKDEWVWTVKKAARITGKVVVDGHEGPLPEGGGYVHVEHGQGAQFDIEPDGTFVVEGVYPGTCRVSVDFKNDALREYVPLTQPELTLGSGETTEVNVEFVKGIRVAGVLKLQGGGELPDQSAVVLRAKSGHVHRAAKTDKSGAWDVHVLPGDYVVEYYVPGVTDGRGQADPITVEEGKPVEGVVIAVSEEKEE